jgi:malonyl-CoA O-methyltransferase
MKFDNQSTIKARSISDGYDQWAPMYDYDSNPLPALEEPRVRELVGVVDGRKVLDLGCGTGRHSAWMAAKGATVVAVDFSAGMLAQARAKESAKSITFIQHDLHCPLPFPNESFDLIISGLVLEHLQQLEPLFREIARVLHFGGRAVLSAMHPAMFLRGSQARFTDPTSGDVVQPGSYPHQISDFLSAGLQVGLRLDHLGEHAPDAKFAARFPRCKKYIAWPMLLLLVFSRPGVA